MKALSILVLTVISIVTIKAQIELFDGRSKIVNAPISKAEKEFVRKEVLANQKAIEKIGAEREFTCAEYGFSMNESASGSFTKKNSKQKAFLYSICLDDEGKYSTPLGGLIIVEGKKVVAHFVYSRRSFQWMKSLPDINSDGFSELAMGFLGHHEGLSITRNVGIYEMKSNELNNTAILTSESYSSNDDIWQTYKGYVKKGNPPVFYAEEFELSEKDKWIKTKDLEKIKPNKESERTFTKLEAKATAEQKKIEINDFVNQTDKTFAKSEKTVISSKKNEQLFYVTSGKSGKVLQFISQQKGISVKETYYLKENKLVYAVEEEIYQPAGTWKGFYYVENNDVFDFHTLGHGKSEEDNWEPDIMERYQKRSRQLKRFLAKK